MTAPASRVTANISDHLTVSTAVDSHPEPGRRPGSEGAGKPSAGCSSRGRSPGLQGLGTAGGARRPPRCCGLVHDSNPHLKYGHSLIRASGCGGVVIGGGNAGLSVAARLEKAGVSDVGVFEPSSTHCYQPLWTLVGGGCAPAQESLRSEASVMPRDVSWIRDRAEGVDCDNETVTTASGTVIGYDHLVVSPGLQLDWDTIPGMRESTDSPNVSSSYTFESAPKTWDLIRNLRRGTAVFTMRAGPIKCAGAPQKIAYLAADYWRRQNVLADIRVVLVLPTPAMFGVPAFAEELERVVARYGIEVHKNTLRHNRFDTVFALGDAGSSPNAKTGAAIASRPPSSSRTCSPA